MSGVSFLCLVNSHVKNFYVSFNKDFEGGELPENVLFQNTVTIKGLEKVNKYVHRHTRSYKSWFLGTFFSDCI